MSHKNIVKKKAVGYTISSKKNMAHQERQHAREALPTKDAIAQQLTSFLNVREHSLLLKGRREAEEVAQDIQFLSRFYSTFLDERIARSEEMASPEILTAVQTAVGMMGSRPGVISCMDGRIPLPVVAGLPMTAAKGLRLPGGDTPGFKHNATSGQLELDPNSQLGRMISTDSGTPEQVQFEIFISHSHCAARARLVGFTGQNPPDQGLFADTFDKSLQGAVLKRDYGIRPINFTYDPETGYGFMGLSKMNTLTDVKNRFDGAYTADVIEHLVADGRVISTKKLAERFAHIFQGRQFQVDWTNDYKASAFNFWTNMQAMGSGTLPEIREQVQALYPDRDEDEIQMRSVFLLASAYSGWLHSSEGQKHPFEKHAEACVVIDYKTKGPFQLSAFIVTPTEGTTPENVLLAETIVRSNRASGNITDVTGSYNDDRFVQASVPVILKQEVDIHSSEKRFWDTVRNLDWSEVNLTWEAADLRTWLMHHVGASVYHNQFDTLLNVVDQMKHTLTELKNNPHIQYLLDTGHLTILPLLVSGDRKPQSIAQLVA